MVQNANEENAGSSPADPVLVMQAMGRRIGFIPAAARLADPAARDAAANLSGGKPLLAGAVGRSGERPAAASGRAMVVVSEGFDVGSLGEAARFVRPRRVQRQPDDGLPGRGELFESRRTGLQRRGAGECRGHRSAARDAAGFDGRSGRGLSQRADGGAVGGPRRRRLHGDDSSRAGPDLSACDTTRCRWSKWRPASEIFPPVGSRRAATT